MTKRHTLKCWTDNFQGIWDGVQTYTIRVNDRNYQVGDTLQLNEYTPPPLEGYEKSSYSGRVIGANITHITESGKLGLKDICVLGIQAWSRRIL